MRVSSYLRIADAHRAEELDQVLLHRAVPLLRHEDAPDRGALLSRLLRHVPHPSFQEKLVHVAARLDIGPEHRGVKAVGFDVDAHRVAHDVSRGADLRAGLARTGEGDDVLRAEVRDEIARRADQEGERALRRELALDDDLHDAMSDHRRACGGLRKHGHAGKQRDGRFFGESPGGEIESVDKDGDTTARHRDMLAVEARRAAELDAFAVDQEPCCAKA